MSTASCWVVLFDIVRRLDFRRIPLKSGEDCNQGGLCALQANTPEGPSRSNSLPGTPIDEMREVKSVDRFDRSSGENDGGTVSRAARALQNGAVPAPLDNLTRDSPFIFPSYMPSTQSTQPTVRRAVFKVPFLSSSELLLVVVVLLLLLLVMTFLFSLLLLLLFLLVWVWVLWFWFWVGDCDCVIVIVVTSPLPRSVLLLLLPPSSF
jgi:hypothetical protein